MVGASAAPLGPLFPAESWKKLNILMAEFLRFLFVVAILT